MCVTRQSTTKRLARSCRGIELVHGTTTESNFSRIRQLCLNLRTLSLGCEGPATEENFLLCLSNEKNTRDVKSKLLSSRFKVTVSYHNELTCCKLV